jgi:hypothetical protein
MIIIPESSSNHPVFDAPLKTWDENMMSPWSRKRLKDFQARMNRIAGLAFNGKPNVRIIWPGHPIPPIITLDTEPDAILSPEEEKTMHWVRTREGKYSKRGRYHLFTQEYELHGFNRETGVPFIQHMDIDIAVRRFVVEQYHLPAEGSFNYKPGTKGQGFYSHLWTVAKHFDDCCGGREANGGHLCLGLYREPSDCDLEELMARIKARDAEIAGHMPGDRVSFDEMLLESRQTHDGIEEGNRSRLELYEKTLKDSFRAHGWRMFTDDPARLSEGKYFDLARRKKQHRNN